MATYQVKITKHAQDYWPTTKISNKKKIIFSDSPSALSTHDILEVSNWPRSGDRISNTNNIPLKPTGNTPSKEYQAKVKS